ncbi:M50 family metallopeptidase [Pedobacter cryophilus]|uniref:M50 family metallopeptidase n=1 Tax=Pedobacter cryophilus TaxID=2571271 RepID=A0A4U1C4E0_9SPHI|nr:M50 family metallopeptidase [Pedobacter cryophilus]TKC00710.1 M50 family metallopeptidase [Pedobacter cryophilus]
MKNKKTLKILGFFIAIVIGAGVGYLVGKFGLAGINLPKTALLFVVFLFVPAFLIVIAFHEAGHAFAGVKVNFDFRMFVVGPFLWNKEQNKWKFKWNKNVNTAGGLVVCLPIGTNNLNKRFAIYAAGGPIASLLLSALAYFLFLLLSSLNTTNMAALQTLGFIFLMLAILSFLIFLITIIPIHSGGFSSDGARILRILKGGEAAHFEVLLLKIIAQSTGGIPPKLIAIDELEEAKTLAKKLNLSYGVYMHGLLHQTTFDLGQLEKAENHLLNYVEEIEEIPAGMRNTVWLDAAFFYAYAKADLDSALKYWNQFKANAFVSKALIYATEAAINFLKSDYETALTKINDSLKEIPNMLDKGNGLALEEKMMNLKNKIQKH